MAGTVGYKFKPGDPEGASLLAVTTGTGKAIPMQECRQIIWTVEGNGTVSGGTNVSVYFIRSCGSHLDTHNRSHVNFEKIGRDSQKKLRNVLYMHATGE